METRVILGVLFGAIVAAAASGQQGAPRTAPAATLYELVLAEWRTCREKGLRLPTDDDGRNVTNGIVVLGATRDAEEVAAPWLDLAEPTAVVRDLLKQAASAPIGEWVVPAGRAGMDQARDFQDLAHLVARLARADLDERADAAIWTALVLLRHARHLQATTSGPFVSAGHVAAGHATSLLLAAVAKLPDDDAHAVLYARSLAAIDLFLAEDRDPATLRKSMRDGIAPRLEAHRARLRDMHQTAPEGYDDARMRAAIERELDRLLDECDLRHQQSGRPWLVVLHELAADPGRRQQGDVTTLAARGIVDLIVCGLSCSSRNDTTYRRTLLDCRDTLAQRL